jgi:hypothetical protein
MKIIITEGQFNDLKIKTKYDFGFNLFKDMVKTKYPFIKNLTFDRFEISGGGSHNSKFFIVRINLTINDNEMKNYLSVNEYGDEDKPFEGISGYGIKDLLEDTLGIIYDRLPKNVRYNYPDDHLKWPGEAAGINITEIKEI